MPPIVAIGGGRSARIGHCVERIIGGVGIGGQPLLWDGTAPQPPMPIILEAAHAAILLGDVGQLVVPLRYQAAFLNRCATALPF